MILILQNKQTENNILKFVCSKCKSIYVADKDSYTDKSTTFYSEPDGDEYLTIKRFECECPVCGKVNKIIEE